MALCWKERTAQSILIAAAGRVLGSLGQGYIFSRFVLRCLSGKLYTFRETRVVDAFNGPCFVLLDALVFGRLRDRGRRSEILSGSSTV